ncbi:probable dihydroxyacetone kinase regulator [Slackia heliotrinireducens]|uniref:Transcriptional regulator n=1 Tax=Slackia heliotrinireducens (strain ATCC 29202 / DSM 20476 / NCTC 11029 / RHS 1) TaxID=471855 RepID=C7N8E8_SLAHD|nr:TetR/AcrR family transcriptional regulator [Slackia heliotrinireducens]ACV23183.1 transcriptional regulator [Slackia heliotrinireducens DSM 20476]VEH02262.1 probable dihydroxyacetone kinase regulator [Slackia heliotrinireducens]
MDRRQRKTQRAIFDAFEALMAEEHYSQVTVAQIIERADIGRSTFYAHFETKDDLIDTICTEMFNHIFEGVNSDCVTHATLETPGLEGQLAHLLYHLRDTHGGVSGKLLMEGEPHFTSHFQGRLKGLLSDGASAFPEADGDFAQRLLVSAFCEAVAWWFERGCKTRPEDVARWFMLPLDR